MRTALIACVSLCALACTPRPPAEDSPASAFRILGVTVEPARVLPGTHAHLTLETFNPEEQAVTALWFACDPGAGLGNAVTMEMGTYGVNADAGVSGSFRDACHSARLLGAGTEVDVTLAAGEEQPPSDPPVTLSWVVGFACAGGAIRVPTDADAWPQCEGPDAVGWVFTRSLFAPTAQRPVRNPVVRALLLHDAAGAVMPLDAAHPPSVPHCASNPCPQYFIEAQFDPASIGPYDVGDPPFALWPIVSFEWRTDHGIIANPYNAFYTQSTRPPGMMFTAPDAPALVHIGLGARDVPDFGAAHGVLRVE